MTVAAQSHLTPTDPKIPKSCYRTIMHLKPETGRSHQLRVHMLSLGHPIIGDEIYSPPEVVAMSSRVSGCKKPGRLCLHAWRLTFAHPDTKAKMTFVSEAPFAKQ